MKKIIHAILPRADIIKNIADSSGKYIEHISKIIISMDTERYKLILQEIDNLNNYNNNINKYTVGQELTLECACEIFQIFSGVTQSINTIMSAIEDNTYYRLTIRNLSPSYASGVSYQRGVIRSLSEKYNNIISNEDDMIIDHIFDQTKSIEIPTIGYNFIISHKNITNKLTMRLIRKLIDSNFIHSHQLKHLIEDQKNAVLNSTRLDKEENKLLSRYNLTPVTKSMILESILKELQCDYNIKHSHSQAFSFAAKKMNCNILILFENQETDIEFNFRGLIDINYIVENNLKTSEESGLTETILEKYNTMIKLPSNKNKERKTEKYIVGGSKEWIILESLSNNYYRILGRLNNKSWKLQEDSIEGLIKGLSLRSHHYNTLHADRIVAICFDPKLDLIIDQYKNVKSLNLSSDPIKNNIIDSLTNWFTTVARENKISNKKEFRDNAVQENIYTDVILDILFKNVESKNKKGENLYTYLAVFDTVIREFTKKMINNINKEHVTEQDFRQRSGDILTKYIIDIFSDLVTKTVNELDVNKLWTDYETTLKEFYLDYKELRE